MPRRAASLIAALALAGCSSNDPTAAPTGNDQPPATVAAVPTTSPDRPAATEPGDPAVEVAQHVADALAAAIRGDLPGFAAAMGCPRSPGLDVASNHAGTLALQHGVTGADITTTGEASAPDPAGRVFVRVAASSGRPDFDAAINGDGGWWAWSDGRWRADPCP